MFNAELIKQNCEHDEDSVRLTIDLRDKGYTFGGAKIESVTMFVDTEQDYEGDLAVNWDTSGLSSDNTNAGQLLMRNPDNSDEVTEIMNKFYWEQGFTFELTGILQDCGFSAEAAENVCGSEWGMQEEGRASYDAYAIAEEIRKAHELVA